MMAEDLRISARQLQKRMEEGEDFTFIDSRNPVAWGESDVKLPGAIRIPADALDEHMAEIPEGESLVVYCT